MSRTPELTFLVKLFLDDRVAKEVKETLAEQIQGVAEDIESKSQSGATKACGGCQSTTSAPKIDSRPISAPPAPVAIENVAQTQAAMDAIAKRQEVMAQALTGGKGDNLFKKHTV